MVELAGVRVGSPGHGHHAKDEDMAADVFADDFERTAHENGVEATMISAVFFLVVKGLPFSWRKSLKGLAHEWRRS